jgi:exodeoxyribonuclease III
VRIATWNILSGGGKRLSAITDRLRSEAADFGLITEYRTKSGEALRMQLADHHLVESTAPINQNGLLAYSRLALSRPEFSRRSLPKSSHRWLAVHVADADILALGVHEPNQRERWNKDDFWQRLCAFGKRHRNSRAIILGDFNTGLDADTENELFVHSPQFQNLLDMGWVDCYRAIHGDRREYSWYSPNGNNGYRLDHVFLSPCLRSLLQGARFDHNVRDSRLSDHSLLTVDLAA